MIPFEYSMGLSAVLFGLGVVGVLVRRNVIVLLMCVELMLNAVNLAFVTVADHLNSVEGLLYVFFVMTVAAAEAAVGLAIVVSLYRARRAVHADEISLLKG
ncbi:NADH-quinone oxidoreductase subunit NuoK [Deferrisoma camini]|uniref:NADH-quinone oxidoreductase subunit NuoK n=1 Tax=Deferrisoma camini TaxID=1035120 RepID=UPI00046D4C26|nr:NADH-quinone oxidoreductase subunit NuoK [Deferrisoma camini]